MAKEYGTKALTEEQKEKYDLRRDAVISKMPRTYWIAVEQYCKKNEIDTPALNSVYSFMSRITYRSDLLDLLEKFVASLKK